MNYEHYLPDDTVNTVYARKETKQTNTLYESKLNRLVNKEILMNKAVNAVSDAFGHYSNSKTLRACAMYLLLEMSPLNIEDIAKAFELKPSLVDSAIGEFKKKELNYICNAPKIKLAEIDFLSKL